MFSALGFPEALGPWVDFGVVLALGALFGLSAARLRWLNLKEDSRVCYASSLGLLWLPWCDGGRLTLAMAMRQLMADRPAGQQQLLPCPAQ